MTTTDKRVLESVVRLHRAIDDQVRNDRKTVDDHFPIVDQEAVTCGTCNNQPWPCLATTKVAIRYGLNPNTLDTK